jgi:hypothetical protein
MLAVELRDGGRIGRIPCTLRREMQQVSAVGVKKNQGIDRRAAVGLSVSRNVVLPQTWRYPNAVIGSMRARSNSAPARPHIDLFSAFNRLIWPSICPTAPGLRHGIGHRPDVLANSASEPLHCIDPGMPRVAEPTLQFCPADTSKQASESHRKVPHCCKIRRRAFQDINLPRVGGILTCLFPYGHDVRSPCDRLLSKHNTMASWV